MKLQKKIENVKMAYNRSQKGSGLLGSLQGVFDYFESLDQMLNNELDWGKFSILYKEYLKDNF